MAPTEDRLKTFVERYERLQEEADALAQDKREVLSEMKSAGFDKNAFKAVIAKRRKMERSGGAAVQEQDALFDLYWRAVHGEEENPSIGPSRGRGRVRTPPPAQGDGEEGAAARQENGGDPIAASEAAPSEINETPAGDGREPSSYGAAQAEEEAGSNPRCDTGRSSSAIQTASSVNQPVSPDRSPSVGSQEGADKAQAPELEPAPSASSEMPDLPAFLKREKVAAE